MNVLIIPEDFRQDQYLLKPIVEAMLTFLGRPRARVSVLTDPLLGGIDKAMDLARLKPIISRYRMVDLFLLCVDRDGEENRRKRLDNIEAEIGRLLLPGKRFFAENAWQEIEVWALAGLDIPPGPWREIRAERDPKEKYFKPAAEARGLLMEPGQGRKTLGIEAAKRYDRLRQLCQEDLLALETRIKEHNRGRNGNRPGF